MARFKTFTNGGSIVPADLNSIQDDYDTKDLLIHAQAGITANGTSRRGKSIIALEEVRTNVAYGTLTTPDQVSVVLPTDGLIAVAYQASYKESVLGAATAALFVGANQTKVPQVSQAAPVTVAAHINSANTYVPLQTFYGGLVSAPSGTAYTGDVTTGQALGAVGALAAQLGGTNTALTNVGGPCLLMAAAGTYTVSVQFKASSGNVSAKDRKLWVWTLGF